MSERDYSYKIAGDPDSAIGRAFDRQEAVGGKVVVEQRGGEVVKVARTVEMPDSMAAAEACQRDFNMVPDTAEKKLALAYYYANM
jgi:hypothetical protein